MLAPALLVLAALWAACEAPEPPEPPPTTTDSITDDTASSAPCEPMDLGLAVSWDSAHPAVPRLAWTQPADSTSAALSYREGSWEHTWDWAAVEQGNATQRSVPIAPDLVTEFALRVANPDGSCVEQTLTIQNGRQEVENLPDLDSTWVEEPESAGRDWFLLYVRLEYDGPRYLEPVLLYRDNGELIAAYDAGFIRTTSVAATGTGFWGLEQNGTYETTRIATGESTTLGLTGWDGTRLETYDQVPYGHHDWALSDDERTAYTLTREVIPEIETRCGVATYGDRVIRADIETGTEEVLWSSSLDGFPLEEGCELYQEGTLVSYLNGLNLAGQTLAASAAGLHFGILVGKASGDWLFVNDSTTVSDLLVQSELGPKGRVGRLFHEPHSVTCTEGVDWGAGAAWSPDAVVCLVSNRRKNEVCQTADLVVLEEASGTAHWLASWPDPDSPDCVGVDTYGNVTLIGDPNPAGDGVTRVALYAPDAARTDVLRVTVTAAGSASIESEYTIVEDLDDTSSHITGYYLTAVPALGPGHSVVWVGD